MSIGEILKIAGIDTLLGMGTVFLILIFISIVIWLLGVLTAADRKSSTAPVAADTKASTAKTEDPNGDPVLVAVITAAIRALQEESGYQPEEDATYVVRNIRRATWKHTLSE